MIIQVRGTSGSGKSTVVREVMKRFRPWEPVMQEGRRKPLYYRCGSLAVLGHYESPCGGCDTIGSAAQVYQEITALLTFSWCRTVLGEGLLLSEDVKWSSQLPELRIVFLTTSLEECLTRVKDRRASAGNDKPLNPTNTANRIGVIERARKKLSDLGIICRRASSEQASEIIVNWITKGDVCKTNRPG